MLLSVSSDTNQDTFLNLCLVAGSGYEIEVVGTQAHGKFYSVYIRGGGGGGRGSTKHGVLSLNSKKWSSPPISVIFWKINVTLFVAIGYMETARFLDRCDQGAYI